MSKEIKIGIFIVLIGVAVLGFSIWLSGNPFVSREFYVLLDSVHGLHKGTVVEYEGLSCGRVEGFEILEEGIAVKIQIDKPQIKLYKTDRFYVTPSSSIVSEFFIFIDKDPNGTEVLAEGDFVQGEAPPALHEMFVEVKRALVTVNHILDQTRSMVKDAQEALGPTLTQFDSTMTDISAVAQSVRQTSEKTNAIITENQQPVAEIIRNINYSTAKINAKLDIISDPELKDAFAKTRESLENIKRITESIERKDIKTFKEAAATTRRLIDKLQSDDPNQDAAILLKRNLQRIDRISAGLEKELKHEKLIKVLFNKVPIAEPESQSNPPRRRHHTPSPSQRKQQKLSQET